MRKRLKKITAMFLIVMTIASVCAPAVSAAWKKASNNTWTYVQNGRKLTGWQKISGVWYYFKSNGVMATGWQKISGVWYYLNPSGAMAIGWKKIDGVWYFFNPSGAMATGWKKISDVWYFFKGSGAMATGWQLVSGKWYYMNSSGMMVRGWLALGDETYYLNPDGDMVTGEVTINGKKYYFDESGALSSDKKPETDENLEGLDEFSVAIYELVNEQRAAAGLKEVKISKKLCEIADARNKELMEQFSHVRPDESQWYTIFYQHGLSGAGTGENIARYYTDPQRLMNDLMASTAHRANILSPYFKYMGLSYQKDANDLLYFVQLFASDNPGDVTQ